VVAAGQGVIDHAPGAYLYVSHFFQDFPDDGFFHGGIVHLLSGLRLWDRKNTGKMELL
jgi:hypothetical protein